MFDLNTNKFYETKTEIKTCFTILDSRNSPNFISDVFFSDYVFQRIKISIVELNSVMLMSKAKKLNLTVNF